MGVHFVIVPKRGQKGHFLTVQQVVGVMGAPDFADGADGVEGMAEERGSSFKVRDSFPRVSGLSTSGFALGFPCRFMGLFSKGCFCSKCEELYGLGVLIRKARAG